MLYCEGSSNLASSNFKFHLKLPGTFAVCQVIHCCCFCLLLQQYWAGPKRDYKFVPVATFAEAFLETSIGKANVAALAEPVAKHLDERHGKGGKLDPLVRKRYALHVFWCLLHVCGVVSHIMETWVKEHVILGVSVESTFWDSLSQNGALLNRPELCGRFVCHTKQGYILLFWTYTYQNVLMHGSKLNWEGTHLTNIIFWTVSQGVLRGDKTPVAWHQCLLVPHMSVFEYIERGWISLNNVG